MKMARNPIRNGRKAKRTQTRPPLSEETPLRNHLKENRANDAKKANVAPLARRAEIEVDGYVLGAHRRPRVKYGAK